MISVTQSYEYATSKELTWSSRMEATLSEIGMREEFLSKDKNCDMKAFQRMKDIFHQEAFADIQKETSKLRTYSLCKTSPGYETYLSEVYIIEERTALTKLRLSNHVLMIEKGRHLKIEKDARFCPFCPSKIEDEQHFLLDCQLFSSLRLSLFEEAQKLMPTFHYVPKTQKFIYLMNNKVPIRGPMTKYVVKAFQLRNFLLGKPKVHD